MQDSDKNEFKKELTLTIQTVSGTIYPPVALIKAFYEALEDLPADKVFKALKQLRADASGWVNPRMIRTKIQGRPEIDQFFIYMDTYVCASRAGEYKDPIGLEVIRRMGGSSVFRQSTQFDRKDLQIRWQKIWKEVEYEQRNHAAVSEGDQRVHRRGATA
jgi:hypothetical protein